MELEFRPHYAITPSIKKNINRIEVVKEKLLQMSLSPKMLRILRETTRLHTTHYSTMIEGNRLSVEQIEGVIKHEQTIGGRERDEAEVKGYYKALKQIEVWADKNMEISEVLIKKLHALIMAGGNGRVKPTPYRMGQNVIRDGRTRSIVYLPPEAQDVSSLMQQFVVWIQKTEDSSEVICPLKAAIVHYQFVTIHPYYDGNGRTARLLTNLVLQEGGYGLEGLYSLEEYYAYNLGGYYEALTIGASHNYYLGRAEADITPWIEYFCEGMAVACENVIKRMEYVE